jgi:predicted Fe-Mo cluster-binding NifX family protein
MTLAVTVWDERISPVYDSADTLLIADIRKGKIRRVSYQSFDPDSERSTETLKLLGVRVLICGAISKNHAALIRAEDIHLIPFITGHVDDILETYADGSSLVPVFLMPGCRNRTTNDL